MIIKRFILLIWLSIMGTTAMCQNGNEEFTLKAAFIYNFTRYIEWDLSSSNDFVIAIIGTSPIYEPLMEIARTKSISNRRIIVHQYTRPEDIGNCNILFISSNCSFPLPAILNRVNKGTLTIGEEPGYAERGTAFNFKVDHDKLRFEANVKAIISAGLKASSQLLKLAKIVD